jgi:hypothetical protein
MRNCIKAIVVIGLWAGLAQAAPARAFELKNGDSVVFIGETVMEQSGFPNMVETFVRTRYPDLELRFFISTMPNEIAADGFFRLDRDVLSLNPAPTVAVIGYGLFDPRLSPFNQDLYNEFYESVERMIEKLKAHKTRVWLLTPPSVDEATSGRLQKLRFNEVLGAYADGVRELAKKHDTGLLDVFKITQETLEAYRLKDPRFGLFVPDSLKPQHAMGLLSAELLKAWQAEPIVTTVTVDWDAKQATVDSVAGNAVAQVQVINQDEYLVDIKGLPVMWPLLHPKSFRPTQFWPPGELSKTILKVNNCPATGLVFGKLSEPNPMLKPFLETEGVDVSMFDPIRSNPDATAIAQAVLEKNNIRTKEWWRKRQLQQVDREELRAAQAAMDKTMEMYVLGWLDIVNKLPKSFDATFRLSSLTPEIIRRTEAAVNAAEAARREAAAARRRSKPAAPAVPPGSAAPQSEPNPAPAAEGK